MYISRSVSNAGVECEHMWAIYKVLIGLLRSLTSDVRKSSWRFSIDLYRENDTMAHLHQVKISIS